MAASIATRLALLERQMADVRRSFGTLPSQEAMWRMHAAEREMRIKADVDAARAQEALTEQQTALEGIIAEMEGLVLFLSKKCPS